MPLRYTYAFCSVMLTTITTGPEVNASPIHRNSPFFNLSMGVSMDTEDFAPQNGTESACACPNRSKPTTTRLKHRIWIDRRTLYPRIRRHISQNNEDCNQSVDAGYCKYVLRGT